MKEQSFNCLFTALLWMLFCGLISLAICSISKPSGETPRATEVVVYHHHIEPQPVLQSPLFPFDLPRPREPAEPTFEPRPEEAIPEARERRNGLIPRFQRPLVDPGAVLPERGPRPPRFAAFPVQRERLLTEMSDRERAAAMGEEERQEKYLEEKESRRYYDRLYVENEAVRATKAAALEEEAARQSHATQSGGEERPKTADKISSTDATEDGQSSPMRIDDTTPKTADTIDSTTVPQDGQSERKKLTINPVIAPYSGGSEATQGSQPISGNNTQSDALEGDNCNNGDVAADSPTNVANATPTTEDRTKEFTNQLLAVDHYEARRILAGNLIKLAEAKELGCCDVEFDQFVYAVHLSWGTWITNCDKLRWDFQKLNKEDIILLHEQLDDTWKYVKRRCEEGTNSHLGQTLYVIEHLGGHMEWAVSYLKQQEKEEEAQRQQQAQQQTQQQQHQSQSVYQTVQQQMVGTTALPQQATTSAQQTTPLPQQQQSQLQQPHEQVVQNTVDENMRQVNAQHQAFKSAGMPPQAVKPPMATIKELPEPEATKSAQTGLNKGKQNWRQPFVESAPPTAGLAPPTPRTPLPDTTLLQLARPTHDPIRASRQQRDFNHRNRNTYRVPPNRITSAVGQRKEDFNVALFASDEAQQKDQEGNRKALDDAMAAKAAEEKEDTSVPGTAGHTRNGSGSLVSTLTSTSSSVDHGPPQVSGPEQPKNPASTFPPGKGPAERRDIGRIGTPR